MRIAIVHRRRSRPDHRADKYGDAVQRADTLERFGVEGIRS